MRAGFKVALSLGLIIILMVAINGFNETRASPGEATIALYDSAQIGVVSRVLNLSLEKGINRVPLDELAGMNVEEITIRPLNEGVQFLGLYSEESSENIYDSNIGSEVEVKTSGGNVIKGKFLGLKSGQLILQDGENLYAVNPSTLVYFKASRIEKKGGVYANFLAEKAGTYPVEVTYRVQGMNWKMRYKLYLSNGTARLIGYVVLSNPTSQEFDNAKVALVSGDVSFYSGSPRYVYTLATVKGGSAEVPVGEPEKVEAFYVYSLGSVDIRPASTMLFPYITSEVRVKREYLYESWAYSGSGNAYESVSFKADHVLPAGIIEIYRENGEGTLLIGESHIEHTPKGDIARIGIGRDYDLKGKTEVLQHQSGDHYAYYKIRITVQNFGDEDKTVIVRHYKYHGKLKSSSVAPSRETDEYVEFTLNVPAGSSKEVTFDYEVNW